MKNNTLGFLLIGLLFIFFNSCKKEKAMEPCNICNKDTSFEAMKEWCYFKEGSWWLYEEENSGEMDTVTVYESFVNDDVEAFEYTAYSTWYENDFKYRHNPDFIGDSNVSSCEIRRFHRSQAGPGGFVGAGLIGNFPIIEGEVSGDMGGQIGSGLQTISSDSTIYINGTEYLNCVYFTIGISGSEDFQPFNVFLSKHIGIARKELPDEIKKWNLIDFHIIQ